MNYIFLFITVFFLASVGTWLVRTLALKKDWQVAPRADRWHQKPTALFGGIGFIPVFVGLQASLLVLQSELISVQQIALMTGVILMFILGWVDDVKPLSPLTKIFAQIIAGGLFIHSGGVLTITHVEIIDICITYFWFLAIINALNMLDNMDGLATGVAGLTAMFLVLVSYSPENMDPLVIPLGISFFATMFAFWLFNRHPASIFMGDSGSLAIGYTLAALAIPGALNANFGMESVMQADIFIMFLITLSLLSIPIFDLTFVTITRIYRGKKPYIGGRDHSSHTLVLLGLSEKQAVFLLYILSIIGGIIAIALKHYTYDALIYYLAYILLLIGLGIILGIFINKDEKTTT
jgi:UDP-GlcNAc:undecaprenyl-phosphate GlcNAc-1-phosphate transferase